VRVTGGPAVDADRMSFARRWARVITDETYVPMSTEELVRYLDGLVGRIVGLLRADHF
jgi:hypothetical protein